MREHDVDLEREDDVVRFLGATLEWDPETGLLEMKQTVLIISAIQLHELGVDLKQEDDATEFLGVTLERNPETNLLEIKQAGLIKRVIKALGLDD